MAEVTVYGAPWCPDCRRAKKFLGEQRVAYDWVDIDRDAEGLRIVEELQKGGRTIPTVVFGDGTPLVEPSNEDLARRLGLTLEATRRSCNRVLACFVFVCVYFVGIYPGAPDWNQRSHYQLLRALGERGTAEIDPDVRDLGWHGDIATRAGHRYSDKAPGLSAAALPAYRLARIFLPASKARAV